MLKDKDKIFKTRGFSQLLSLRDTIVLFIYFDDFLPFILSASTVLEKYLPCIAALEFARHSPIRDTHHQAIQAQVPR
jgi:hypothetical protein